MNFISLLTAYEFFRDYGLLIAFIAAGAVFIAVVVFFIIAVIKRRKNPVVHNEPKVSKSAVNKTVLLEAIGGLENMTHKQLSGSRISLELKDVSLVDEQKLNSIGVDRVIKMSNKITLVIKGDVSSYYRALH